MKKLVFIQMNLRMLESMGIDDAIQELNSDEIDITKISSLPSWLEFEDQYFVLMYATWTRIYEFERTFDHASFSKWLNFKKP